MHLSPLTSLHAHISTTIPLASLQGTSQPVLSFDRPAVDGMRRNGVGVASNMGSSSDSWLLLSVGGFGSNDWSIRVRIGATHAESTIWRSASELYSRYAAGTGKEVALVITFLTHRTTQLAMLSFDQPVITAVHPYNMPAQGQSTVEFLGASFGAADFTAVAHLGHTACMFSEWTSQSSITCKVPAGSAVERAALKLTLQGASTRPSQQATFTYNTAPGIERVYPNFAPSKGGVVITAMGKSMSLSKNLELQLWMKVLIPAPIPTAEHNMKP